MATKTAKTLRSTSRRRKKHLITPGRRCILNDAEGLRSGKTTGQETEHYVYDGDQLAVTYYHYDAHGNVAQLTDSTGTVVKNYTYEAFGVEQSPSDTDTNPFRYCGEQYDAETGNYYLRARYYTPGTGRFTQADTHWNPSNMVYGDNPQKWNEYRGEDDSLGLHTYKPDFTAVAQAGNLYGYGLNNPIAYYDPKGELAWPGEIHNQVVNHIATQYQYYSEETILGALGTAALTLLSGGSYVPAYQ